MKLSVRISLLIGILVLALTAALGGTALIVSSSIIENSARESLRNQATLGADLLKASIGAQLRVLEDFATRSGAQALNVRNFDASLKESIARTGFLDIAVVTPDGNAYYYNEQTRAFLGDRDYVKSAFAGNLSVSDVLISRVTRQPVLMFGVPVRNEAGAVIGALIGQMNGNALTDIIKNVKFGKTGYAYIVNNSGTFIAHRNTDLVTQQYNPVEAAVNNPAAASFDRAVADMLKNESGFLTYEFNGRNHYAGFVSIGVSGSLPWKFVITVERGEMLAGISRLTTLVAGAGLVLLLAGIVVAILIGRSVSRPINFSARVLKDISEGEGNLTKRLELKSKDEIGDLARYFNKMVTKIEELILLIRERALTLRQISDGLSEHMTLTAASIKDINDTVINVNVRVKEQSESVVTSIGAMSLVSENIDSLDEEVVHQAKSVEGSAAAITKMLESIRMVTDTLIANDGNVKRLIEASGVGRNRLSDVATDIQGIARESEGLLEINAVMENIASQTNLLSMNAAIEAAHAGELGKGFAVVSDEIRKLSMSSAEQSKTISAVLKKIKSSIDKITLSTSSVLSEFESIDDGIKTVAQQEESIRDAMEEQGEGSRLILDEISRLKKITTMVKKGTSEMLEKSKSVIKESRNLEGLSAEIKFSMDEMAINAANIISSVRDMNAAGGKNKENINALVEEVSRFKVSKRQVTAGTAMPGYVWDETFATGNETIDSQHRTLFDALNRLLAAIQSGKTAETKGELKKAVDFLNDYTIKHFFEEEQIQQQANYPDYPNHHKMHEDFKVTVRELSRELIIRGANEDLVATVRKKLGEWLVTHIKGQDIKLGLYLRDRHLLSSRKLPE
ncbi:MAG: bacteriohemerythrin [Spirochaetaceae bacterium]|jgi:methyl-accepting chemotaxis protein|nr:bacteriohemerythrin [Spirochaetaceae bacterium]